MQSGDRSRNDGGGGFTLVEMLVAIAVAAVVLTGVMRLFSTSLAGAGSSDAYAQASLLAQTKLDALGGMILTTTNGADGDEGPYHWRASVSRYGDAVPGAYLLPYEIAVSVAWRDAGRDRSLSLRSIRLGPQR